MGKRVKMDVVSVEKLQEKLWDLRDLALEVLDNNPKQPVTYWAGKIAAYEEIFALIDELRFEAEVEEDEEDGRAGV